MPTDVKLNPEGVEAESLTNIAITRDWLCRKYTTNADARQREMGLEYIEAEVTDVAREIERYCTRRIASALAAAHSQHEIDVARIGELTEALTEISSPTQTLNLLWWQKRARSALATLALAKDGIS